LKDLFDILSEEDYNRIPGRGEMIPNTDDIEDDNLPYGYYEVEDEDEEEEQDE